MSKNRVHNISETHAEHEPSEARTARRIDCLISSRQLKLATTDLLELGKPMDESHELSISEALREQRSET